LNLNLSVVVAIDSSCTWQFGTIADVSIKASYSWKATP